MDRVEDIHTGKDGLNRLVIKDGKAWVETASCPDGICAAHKPIHREGESIVCLPNKVVITVSTATAATNPTLWYKEAVPVQNKGKDTAFLGLCVALALGLAYIEVLMPPLLAAVPGI